MKKVLSIICIWLICSQNMLIFAEEAKKEKTIEGPVIGIDLGTTYSCVGIFRNGSVEIIPNELGNRITPSVVAFTDEERLVGEAAKNQAALNPKRTIYSVKRLIGRRYNDKEVQMDKKLLPYDIIDKNGKPYISFSLSLSKYNKSSNIKLKCKISLIFMNQILILNIFLKKIINGKFQN